MSELIYKYLSTKRITYLKNEFLRISQPSALNDPFECLPSYPSYENMKAIMDVQVKNVIISINNQQISELEKTNRITKLRDRIANELKKIKNKEPNTIREIFYDQDKERINKSIGILSLSKRWDNPLMWAHYADSHSGFCLGFDMSSNFFNNNNNGDNVLKKWFVPVKYSTDRHKIPTQDGLYVSYEVLYTKSIDWEYEKEYRLLVSLKEFADKIIDSEPLDIYLIKVPHGIVKEIIIGLNFPNEKLGEVLAFGKVNKIPVYQTTISEYEFSFERVLR